MRADSHNDTDVSTLENLQLLRLIHRGYVTLANDDGHKLRATQWDMLRIVQCHERSGTPASVSRIACAQNTTLGTVSTSIRALESRGLVWKGPRTRQQPVHLTDKGREVLQGDPLTHIVQQLVRRSDWPEIRRSLEVVASVMYDADAARLNLDNAA